MSKPRTITAWETEDAVLVVFGTHFIHKAIAAARKFYDETIGERPDDLSEELHASLTNGGKQWAHPAVLEIEEERWPDSMKSVTPVEGWVPFLVVTW